MKVTISEETQSKFYSTQMAVIAGESVADVVGACTPEGVSLFILSEDGLVFEAGQIPSYKATDMQGMPIGLLGAIIGKPERAAAAAFSEVAILHETRNSLEVLDLADSIWRSTRERKICTFIAQALVNVTSQKLISSATHLKQLVVLRAEHEQLLYNYQLAKDMISGIGFSRRFCNFELAPGMQSIGPEDCKETFQYRQYLPIDLAGLAGVWLFVEPDSEVNYINNDGYLTIVVRRAADEVIIGSAEKRYLDLKSGWTRFYFETVYDRCSGDAILEILWAGQGGPRLSLADVSAVRFGDALGRSLAMRLETGLSDSAEASPSFYRAFEDNKLPRVSGCSLLQGATLIGGSVEKSALLEELGADFIQGSEEFGWLQLHGLKDRPVGIEIKGRIPKLCSRLSLEAEIAHAGSAPFKFTIVVTADGVCADQLIQDVLATGLNSGHSVNNAVGYIQKTVLLKALEKRTLTLDLEDLDINAENLLLIVSPTTASNDFAHCRWNFLDMYVPVVAPKVALDVENFNVNPLSKELSQFRFSELASQLSYYRSPTELEKISRRIGYSPYAIDDDRGYLQTHPFERNASIACLSHVISAGVTRISCEIATAHALGAEFTYFIAIIPKSIEQPAIILDQLAESLRCGDVDDRGSTASVEWSAMSVPASQNRQISMKITKFGAENCNLFCAALSRSDNAAFGWCRWYKLSIEKDRVPSSQCLLQPAPKDDFEEVK
jgi:hypothetical protein